jgi:hypothetical protein
MMGKNIPEFLRKTGFSRFEIHEIFARYKALLGMECEKIKAITKESNEYLNKLSDSSWN